MNKRTILAAMSLLSASQLKSADGTPPYTDIAITSAVARSSLQRFGVNLGQPNYYDAGQMMKNLVFANPGFEPELYQSTIRCTSTPTGACEDRETTSGWSQGFWNGAKFEFFYGAARGRTGRISSYSAAGDKRGGVFTFSGSGPAPVTGDYMIVRKTMPGSLAAGWTPVVSGGASIAPESSDLPPQTAGKQSLRLAAPPGGQASISTYIDNFSGRSFLRLDGVYELRFKAKGISGSPGLFGASSVAVLLERETNPKLTYLHETVSLADGWTNFTLRYEAAETGVESGAVTLRFTVAGSNSVLIDEVSLTQQNTDPNNTTQFRDLVVDALKNLKPGVLRFWADQLGDTLDNLLAPPFGRQRAGYSAWYREPAAISYGLHEFLELCESVGADPWIVVPTTFSTAEAADLVQYLAGSSTTPYGQKRAARGHPAPWTGSFHKIHLEFGNEAWNSILKGGSIEYPEVYGNRAQHLFQAMRDEPNFRRSSFDLVLGGQADWPGRNTTIQNNCDNNDSFAVASYLMGTVDSYDSSESLFGSTFAEPEAFVRKDGIAENVKGGGMLYEDEKAIASSTHPVPLLVYETNLTTVQGSIPQDILDRYTTSLGAGLAVADNMLLDLRQFGMVTQNVFTLAQYRYKRADGKSAFLWGIVVDMGNSNRKRPQYLALQMVNEAMETGASMLRTVHTGADPTWDQPLENTVQLKGAHDLQSFAFADGDRRSLVLFNLDRESSLPVTFSGANAPSGLVEMQQLTSPNLTDTNEDSETVNIQRSSLGDFDARSPLPLPAFSMTVLRWHALMDGPNRQPSAQKTSR